MGKTRVGVRMKEAIGAKKSMHKSEDLEQLNERFKALVVKLRGLIAALKAQYGAMVQLSKTRTEVANRLAALAANTPLHEQIGQMPGAGRPTDSVLSYRSISESLASKTAAYTTKYAQFVVDYAIEWEKVIVARVTNGMAQVEKNRVEVDHYQQKAEKLRQGANAAMSKGKQVDSKTQEKLSRNEEKLLKSKQAHSKFTVDMCMLIEEITDRSWRDLHPLLVKVAQFDITLSDDEAKALGQLNSVVSELKRLATTHGIKPQARLKDLNQLDPTLLSTKKPGEGGSSEFLALENGSVKSTETGPYALDMLAAKGGLGGVSGLGPTISPASSGGPSPSSLTQFGSSTDMNRPPGTVSAQGMGGFPVQVQSTSFAPNHMGRASSFSSGHSAPASSGNPLSTMEMLNISASAAPPPTMDQINALGGGNAHYGGVRSAPNSGPLPPMGPGAGRNYSLDSDSVYSGSAYSAPAPMAPPPPPPGGSASMVPSSSPYNAGNGLSMYSNHSNVSSMPSGSAHSNGYGAYPASSSSGWNQPPGNGGYQQQQHPPPPMQQPTPPPRHFGSPHMSASQNPFEF